MNGAANDNALVALEYPASDFSSRAGDGKAVLLFIFTILCFAQGDSGERGSTHFSALYSCSCGFLVYI
jgi:hypothetical protein